jgi:hypothetical protein
MENSSLQSPPPQTNYLKGCLIAFAVGILLLVAAYYAIIAYDEYQHNKFITEQCTKYFNYVKAGGSGCLVIDPLGIEMLASDEQCIANLKYLHFTSVDLSDPRYESVTKLKNLRTIEFYDCHNDDKLLAAMQGMPSVEEMEFDSMRESAERERLLKTFPNLKTVTYE